MRVFHFHARASLTRLMTGALLQISPLATKVREAGAQGADAHPGPPQGTCKRLPGALAGFQRSQPRGEKPTRGCPRGTRAPQYLMLPFGGRLLFHLRHKHTRHLPLHRAQAPHGGPNSAPRKRTSEHGPIPADRAISRGAQDTHTSRPGTAAAPTFPHTERGAGTYDRKRPPCRSAFWEL